MKIVCVEKEGYLVNEDHMQFWLFSVNIKVNKMNVFHTLNSLSKKDFLKDA